MRCQLTKKKNFLLAYDIADPKRLSRVRRRVTKKGIALQYSVYFINTSYPELDVLLADINRVIKPELDDVRVYPLPKKLDIVRLGDEWISPGLQLVGHPLSQGIRR